MKKPSLAVTGLSGFLGRSILPQLLARYRVVDLYNRHPLSHPLVEARQLNLLELASIAPALRAIRPNLILHMAAYTHIDHCEADRSRGTAGNAWKLNVLATEQVALYSQVSQTHLTFMSTECVFDGTQTAYSEHDAPNPKNWYGETKFQAEQVSQKSGAPVAVVRAVIAYNASQQTDNIYGHFATQFKLGKPFQAVADQQISPTHTNNIASVLESIVNDRLVGTFHTTPMDTITPYEFALLVARRENFDTKLVKPTTMEKFFGKKRAALRLQNATLDSSYTNKQLGFSPQTIATTFATM